MSIPATTPRVSLCMIVRDEEHQLARCLASAVAWVDELIVVDTGSRDATVEIARSLGADVSHFEWCDDFSAARNAAIDQAHGYWVFSIDADEVVADGCGPRIRQLAAAAPEGLDAYAVKVRHYYDDDPAQPAWTDNLQTRLFRNRSDLRWTRRVHELLVRDDGSHQIPAAAVKADGLLLEHYGYLKAERRRRSKADRNLVLLEAEAGERPEQAINHFYLGRHHLGVGAAPEAIAELRQALALIDDLDQDVAYLSGLYQALVQAHLRLGDTAAAIAAAREGLSRCPTAELACLLADQLAQQGQSEAALTTYERARELQHAARPSGADSECPASRPLLGMAALFGQMGRVDAAVDAYAAGVLALTREAAAEIGAGAPPGVPTAAVPLGDTSDPAELQHAYDELSALVERQPDSESHRLALADLLLDAGEAAAAVEVLAAGVTDPPRSAGLYLRLGVAFLRLRQDDEARDAFAVARVLAPDSPTSELGLLAAQLLSRASGTP